MNIRSFIITLAAWPCLLAGEPDGAKPSVAKESLAPMKETSPNQPAVTQEFDEKIDSSGEEVKMERFVVVDSLTQRDLSKKFQSESKKRKDEQFSFSKGGTIYKNERFDFGASRNQDLFKEDAKYKDKKPVLKIDLLHLRF